jgi:hypothetical protein
MQPIEENEERFEEASGDVRIEEHGHLAIHSSLQMGDAFVRATSEYSLGKHHIRFVVKKKDASFYLFFGIISKLRPMPQHENDIVGSTYGWQSNDTTIIPATRTSIGEDIQDLRNQTTLEIELLLDCDQRKISYFNQQTRRTREINVDITICPFPWQLLFYLFDIGDCVQLLPSNR